MEQLSKYNIDIPTNKNLSQFILENCRTHGSRTALIDALTDERISYSEFVDEVCRCSSALLELGVRQGDKICLFSQNSVQYPIIYLSIINIQAVCVPVNHTSTSYELEYFIEDSESSLLFVNESNVPVVEDLLKNSADKLSLRRQIKAVIVFGTETRRSGLYTRYQDFILRAGLQGPHRNETGGGSGGPTLSRTVATLCYSSGTTGKPKGCEQSHYSYIADTLMICEQSLGLTRGGVTVAVLSMFHMFGQIMYLIHALYVGTTLVVCARYCPQSYFSLIQKHRATHLHVVPPIMSSIITILEKSAMMRDKPSNYFMTSSNHIQKSINHNAVSAVDTSVNNSVSADQMMTSQRDEVDYLECLKTVRYVMSSAATLSASTGKRFQKLLPWIKILEGWGMTECMLVLVNSSFNSRIGSCGQLMPNCKAKIVDRVTGETLGPGSQGELLIHSPSLMNGYFNKEEATRSSFDADHYLKSGDLGYYDEEGFFYIVGRIKDQLRYKGHQISPLELECILLKHPAVTEAAVIGIPDEICGDLPRAFVVLHKSDLEVRPTVPQLINFLHARISPYKYLRGGLEITDNIPKNASGKILRNVLVERAISSARTTASKL